HIDCAEKFTTIYSGFDVEPLLTPRRDPQDVRTQWGFRPEHLVIGKIARLFHLKGHEFLFRAAPKIVAAHPHVRFLLVGDGILRETFEREIAALGLTDHFVFTGLVPPAQIPELIHAMDLVVHTSQWEGLARVLPQALIAGKSVVTYDVGGAREVIIPGETGYVLPRDTVDELAAAVCELAGDAALRERLGRTGRERFTDQFRHETMTRRIREVYARVLG
ncbi:MAG: glycosyltransferase, partial [Planctomycetaceae bacterium]|nr:glycosyltransferase [Planctomycetaceae bacterium]